MWENVNDWHEGENLELNDIYDYRLRDAFQFPPFAQVLVQAALLAVDPRVQLKIHKMILDPRFQVHDPLELYDLVTLILDISFVWVM